MIYFIPSTIAYHRRHHRYGTILLLNLVFGWTGLGWLALVLYAALSEKEGAWAYRERMARAERLAQDERLADQPPIAVVEAPIPGTTRVAPRLRALGVQPARRATFMDALRGSEDTASPALVFSELIGAVLGLVLLVVMLWFIVPPMAQGVWCAFTSCASPTTATGTTPALPAAAPVASRNSETPATSSSGTAPSLIADDRPPREFTAIRTWYAGFRAAEAVCLEGDSNACDRAGDFRMMLLDQDICSLSSDDDDRLTFADCRPDRPPEIQRLADAFYDANGACRGGIYSEQTDAICAKRDALVDSLRATGWCVASPREWVVSCVPWVPGERE